MIEQNECIALEISNRTYVLEKVQNRLEGTEKNLLKDKEIRHVCLRGHF